MSQNMSFIVLHAEIELCNVAETEYFHGTKNEFHVAETVTICHKF